MMIRSVEVVWNGETYIFTPSFDLLHQIEEKVSINRISAVLGQAARTGDGVDVPISHVSTALFFCLRAAGAPVKDPLQVQHAIVQKRYRYGHIFNVLMEAYYGSGPEKPAKKSRSGRKRPPLPPRSSSK